MMTQTEISIERAKAEDASEIAEFVNRTGGRRALLEKMDVIERFGDVGLFVAKEEGAVVGILGWQIENLVARVTDLLVRPASLRDMVGKALLSTMEDAASELQCEAAILSLPKPTPSALVDFGHRLGYEPTVVSDLPRAWREAANEVGFEDNDTVLLKKLRSDRVMRPF